MINTSEMLDLFMIGDKLATTAQKLGILPRAMATSQIPLIEQMFPGIDNLECTRCIMTSKRQILYSAAKKTDIYRVSLEKDSDSSMYWSGLNPEDIKEELHEKGFTTDIADFSNGLFEGIIQTGEIYNKQKQAKRLIKNYESKLDEVKPKIPDCSGLNISIVLGMINPFTGDHYLLPQGKDTYLSKTILNDLKCGNSCKEPDLEKSPVIEDLLYLKKENPHVIVFTGDSQAGFFNLYQCLKNDPDFKDIPAVKNHAVFSLPHLSGGNPIDYPWILDQWARAFSEIEI